MKQTFTQLAKMLKDTEENDSINYKWKYIEQIHYDETAKNKKTESQFCRLPFFIRIFIIFFDGGRIFFGIIEIYIVMMIWHLRKLNNLVRKGILNCRTENVLSMKKYLYPQM